MTPRATLAAAAALLVAGCTRESERAPTPMHLGRSIADVAERVTPSVVSIMSERPDSDEGAWLFGRGAAREHAYSLGSGVIVAADGVIVTNSHVIAGADKVWVALADGRTLEARLAGSDLKSDVAVLRVDATDLPALPVADSSALRIGDVVLAVGNPYGIGQTVTMGIVSAVGRANMGITDYDDFIQTDAAINPGSSGGALVDMNGRLVGINTAIISRTGGYQGIGFAIPSRMAIPIKDALLAHGRVIRGWLGIEVRELDADHARASGVEPGHGVTVAAVVRDSPADDAGLRAGDVITAVDGVAIREPGKLRNAVAMRETGSTLAVEASRGGDARSFEVVIGERPEDSDPPLERAPEVPGAPEAPGS